MSAHCRGPLVSHGNPSLLPAQGIRVMKTANEQSPLHSTFLEDLQRLEVPIHTGFLLSKLPDGEWCCHVSLLAF